MDQQLLERVICPRTIELVSRQSIEDIEKLVTAGDYRCRRDDLLDHASHCLSGLTYWILSEVSPGVKGNKPKDRFVAKGK